MSEKLWGANNSSEWKSDYSGFKQLRQGKDNARTIFL